MSNSEGGADKVRLTARADTRLTEIFVIDGKFRRVAKGLGYLDTRLPPGIYTVKFKAGSVSTEIPAVLQPEGKDVNVSAPGVLDFSSAAPLRNTRTTHEYHRHFSELLSKEVHHTAGSGSEVFVFIRDLDITEPADVMSGLTLHHASGEMLVDLSAKGRRGGGTGGEPNPWAGCTLRVDPGSYRIRVRVSPTEALEQTIVACHGWQTQVFLMRRDCIPGESGRYPDLADASIFMAPMGRGFQPDDEPLRWTELAKLGLLNRRDVVPREDLGNMLFAKFENPMMGIYGAHLLLLSPDPDMGILKEVTKNLYSLVGSHPDVRALTIFLDRRTGEKGDYTPFYVSPMLASSWKIAVNATVLHPYLVPSDSLAAQVSDRLWGDSPWLIWETPEQPGAAVPCRPVDLAAFGSLALKLSQEFRDRSKIEQAGTAASLAPLEQDLLHYLVDAVLSRSGWEAVSRLLGRPDSPFRSPGPASLEQSLSAPAIVEALGVPLSVASKALEGIVSKLSFPPQA